MTVLEYSPLWQRPSNACLVCTPKLIDLEYSNYYIEDDFFLYIVFEGENYIVFKTESTPNVATFDYELTARLRVINEAGEQEFIQLVYGCNYEYGYAELIDGSYDYGDLVGSIQFVDTNDTFDECIKDVFRIKYTIGCTDTEWVYIVKGAVNRLPAELADEGVGILPNGQGQRYFARINKKSELRIKEMSETDLDILEYAINQPTIKVFNFDVVFNIAEGSVFTFDQESYGIYFGLCELVQSTLVVEKCCDTSGS